MLKFNLYSGVWVNNKYTKSHILVNPDLVTHITQGEFSDQSILWLTSGIGTAPVFGTLNEIENRIISYKDSHK